ncbi:hypothetical protein [Nocardia noduli]|uniref:hypothetical protein n=1 Tax=Nocardia noduli TaxID=2815722 RepID=UPI001C22752C|nr:hypothetical protein [Nocardia noduli]
MIFRPSPDAGSTLRRFAGRDSPTADSDTIVSMLLRGFMLAQVATFVLGMSTALARRRSINAAHHAVTHFGDHHDQ